MHIKLDKRETSDMIKIRIAELNVEIHNRYDYIEKLARDYLYEFDKADISVGATDEEIEKERVASEYNFEPGYLESIVIYRNIAEKLPMYSAVVFHGAVIACEGCAYMVTARSGVGKTTHLRLWLKEFGDKVHILNGDKPILRMINGKVYACATPWRGKEGYGRNELLPLLGIGFIERDSVNSSKTLTPEEGIMKLASQVYVPKNSESAPRALLFMGRALSSIPLLELRVNMEPEAAHMAKAAFSRALL
jgi:hypothetical protein